MAYVGGAQYATASGYGSQYATASGYSAVAGGGGGGAVVLPGGGINSGINGNGGINGGINGGGGGVIGGGGASAGECAGACGGMEVACCEAEGAVVKTDWQYVGQGCGSYNPQPNYCYVGNGCGSYDKEVTTVYYGWKFRKCCIGLGGLLLLAGLIWLLMCIINDGGDGTDPIDPPPIIEISTPAPSPNPEPNRPLYDCGKPGLWTLAKKDWCCKHYGRGCPTHPPPPHTTPCPPKPPPVIPHPVPIPAPAPAPAPVPVMPPVVHTSLPFDCNADYLNCYTCLMHRWSDCSVAYKNWRAAWTTMKKQYCCQHEGKGCE